MQNIKKINYTPAQQSAIDTKGCNLLVSAAAGSGKTAVLVERIIRIISDPEKLIDIDNILVVTFTDAAAAEMRMRIADAIYKRLNDESLNNPRLYEHLRKQSLLLNKAQISTLHSFCLSVIRANFFAVSVDPFFKTADKAESDLLKMQALDNTLEREYKSPDEDGKFYKFYQAFSERGDAEALRDTVIKFYEFLSSIFWQDEWMQKHKNAFAIKCDSLDGTAWWFSIKMEVQTALSGIIATCYELLHIARTEAFGYDEAIESDIEQIEEMLKVINDETKVFSDIEAAIRSYKPATLKAAKGVKVKDSPTHAHVSEIRTGSIKGAMKKLKDTFFLHDETTLINDIKGAYDIIDELCRVTNEFKGEYMELKKEKNLLDFNDLEYFCIRCLLDQESTSDNIILSQTAINLREKFEEVMVDEYQDINELQELILQCVSNNNCFMVGDLKQSIYRFRQAKPELFAEKYKLFAYEEGNLDRKIDLSGNFRSSKSIINKVNFLFRQIMTEQYGGTNYSEKEELSGGNVNVNLSNKDPAVEVLIIDISDDEESLEFDENEDVDDLKSSEIEAIAVANRINGLVNAENPLQLFDKKINSLRDVRYGDIAILVRSVKSVSAAFDEVFKKTGIPLHIGAKGENLLDSFEVKVALSFLQVIDNPLQDIAVMAMLYCPVYQVTADEMVQISNMSDVLRPGFYNKIISYVENEENQNEILLEKLKKFINDVSRWQEMALTAPISSILDIILAETGYLNYASVMLKGNERRANLMALKEYAFRYEKSSYKGIFNFIRYIEKLKKSKSADLDMSVLSEDDNVVRILTIHKSKGLEFPIVFVSRTGAAFNRKDESAPLLFNSSLGFGIQYLTVRNDIKYKIDTISRAALKCKARFEDLSEQIRNLYVAATRAEERLIFTGTVKNIERNLNKWQRYESHKELKLPTHFIAGTNNYLDLIMTAANRHEIMTTDTEIDVSYFTRDYVLSARKAFELNSQDGSLANLLTEEGKEIQINIENKFNWIYPCEADCLVRAKISVSEAKRIYQNLTESIDAEPMFKRSFSPSLPDFMTGEKRVTGSERGMAIHTVMEHIDLNKHVDVAAIRKLLDELVHKQILSKKLASSVPIDKIYNFAKSNLAERMRHSNNVKREVSFIMNVSAHEIYGDDYKKSDQNIIIQGVIDCYFEENGGIIIVDYKSDIGSEAHIKEQYEMQMRLYKEGIKRSTQKEVTECLLYLFESETIASFNFNR